jgi:hypothetical protein
MPGIENLAPDRTDTSSGSLGSPSLRPIAFSSLNTWVGDLVVETLGPPAVHVVAAGVGRHREARRDRQLQHGRHLGEVGTLATQQVLVGHRGLAVLVIEGVDVHLGGFLCCRWTVSTRADERNEARASAECTPRSGRVCVEPEMGLVRSTRVGGGRRLGGDVPAAGVRRPRAGGFVLFLVLIAMINPSTFGLWIAVGIAVFTSSTSSATPSPPAEPGADAEISLDFLAGYTSFRPRRPLSRLQRAGITAAGPAHADRRSAPRPARARRQPALARQRPGVRDHLRDLVGGPGHRSAQPDPGAAARRRSPRAHGDRADPRARLVAHDGDREHGAHRGQRRAVLRVRVPRLHDLHRVLAVHAVPTRAVERWEPVGSQRRPPIVRRRDAGVADRATRRARTGPADLTVVRGPPSPCPR